MSAFSTDVRILTCPQCGAPIQLSRMGGQSQCQYCHAPLTVAARDDGFKPSSGPQLTEQERYQGLWAQHAVFGAKQLPPEMVQVLHGGALTPDRAGPALTIWRNYCQRASAGDFAAGEFAVLMTGSLSSYFVAVAKDPQRQRALFESTYDALRDPSQKQVVRCMLARSAAKAGDLASAKTWFGACDPRSPDLQADTAYRVTYATLATYHNDFRQVLVALGPYPQAVPIALPSLLMSVVVRANAIEKLGDVQSAVMQLVQVGRASPDNRASIPGIVDANGPMHLCPQSIMIYRQQV
jgi:hypothetical protein